MNWRTGSNNRLLFHLAGLIALMAVHFVADFDHFQQRTGFNKYSPYLFLLLLYGWIIFHNLVLFDGLYLKGKRQEYFTWTAVALFICTLNMFFILVYGFNVSNPWPQIINFWIYTILGWGIYMGYRYLSDRKINKFKPPVPGTEAAEIATHFDFMSDGEKHKIFYENILYLESLENYIKVHTLQKVYIVRQPLKEAELNLPGPLFIRISRSHIINTHYIQKVEQDSLTVAERIFKIGKVYKKYVEDQLGSWKSVSNQ